jgi:hypothetical protein
MEGWRQDSFYGQVYCPNINVTNNITKIIITTGTIRWKGLDDDEDPLGLSLPQLLHLAPVA